MTTTSTDSRKERRRAKFRLVAVAMVIIVCLLILFSALEFRDRFFPVYVEEPGGHRFVHDRLLGWRNIPGAEMTTLGRTLTINSKGLRDREYPYEKPEGTKRILVLGDSFAWGYGVADNEVFSEVLEADLQGRQPRFEVLNTGVLGWGTDQEYLYLVHEGLKYSPDYVILALYSANDPKNNYYSMQGGLHKPVFLNEQLELGNVPVPAPEQKVPLLISQADSVDLTVAIVRRMAADCVQHGSHLIVVKFGMFLGFEDPVWGQHDRRLIQQIQMIQDIDFLDLDQEFAARELSVEQLTIKDDPHWNAFGHRQTAAILLQFLADRGIVPSD